MSLPAHPRVLHATTARSWRGGEQQVLLLLEGLVRRGVDCRLLAPPRSPLLVRALARGLRASAWPVANEADPRALARLTRELRRERPDVLHLHTSQAHGLGAAAARLVGRSRPALVVTRRVEHSIFRHSLLGLDRLKVEPGVDLVLCVSDRVRAVLEADGVSSTRLQVVPDGVDLQRFRPRPEGRAPARTALRLPADAWVVGCVGRLEPAKGPDLLLEAVVRLGGGAHLVWIGEGRGAGGLEQAAAAQGLGPRLHLPGFRPDVDRLLPALDAFAFPSHTEGLGSAVLEAMAAGLPVVASRVGGIPEAIRDGEEGLLVPAGDVPALAAALGRLRGDPRLADRLGRAAADRARRVFGAERMVAGTLAGYRSALRRAG